MEYIPAPSDIIHTIVTAPAESPSCYAIQWNDRARLEDCRFTGRRTRLITASIAATALTRHEIFPDWDETILELDDLALTRAELTAEVGEYILILRTHVKGVA
ncbi:hypothetical protein CFAM422_006929 [Trichoderma lentiforme]|uniref:Uncharacterized protein n=1 Tax=Trichoderma lentiforme TaxID=1567552 RepID=A0A9P4XEU3_9HYPO|nr:hypothetical protein CFAM422_006929 [Trichoderma lentiforme]